jgi:hypothetical protein
LRTSSSGRVSLPLILLMHLCRCSFVNLSIRQTLPTNLIFL